MNPPKRSSVVRNLLLFGVWAPYIWLLMRTPLTSRWLDFSVYWDAGKKALIGVTVYDVVGHFQYKYSPLIALIFGKVFQSLTFESASWIFQKSMLFIWLVLFLRFTQRNFLYLWLVLLFFGNAIRLDLELGQINALVVYLLVLLFAVMERESSWREDLKFAFIFAIAVQLKLFCFILIPLLLIQKEWRKLVFGLIFIPLLSVGGLALAHGFKFGLSENIEWLRSLSTSTDDLLLSSQNTALLASATKVFGLLAGKTIWFISGIIFLGFIFRNRGRSIIWFRNRLLYAIAIFNPLVWSYWIFFAIPLFVEKVENFIFPKKFTSRAILILATLFIFAAFNGQHATWAWNGGIFGALVLLALIEPRRFLADHYGVFPHAQSKPEGENAPQE